MSTTTAASVINKAAILLLDLANVRWTRAELLGWINDAQRAVALSKPDASNSVASVKLIAGTKQALPPDAWLLMDVVRNMGTNGTTPGQAIRIVTRELIDAMNPSWHASPQVSVIDNYIYNVQDQISYYVYPPSDGTGYIELNYAQLPPDVLTEANLLVISDIYVPVVLDYIMYRCCSKDAEYAAGLRLASAYYKSFATAMGMVEQSEMRNNPDLELGPRDATIPGAAN